MFCTKLDADAAAIGGANVGEGKAWFVGAAAGMSTASTGACLFHRFLPGRKGYASAAKTATFNHAPRLPRDWAQQGQRNKTLASRLLDVELHSVTQSSAEVRGTASVAAASLADGCGCEARHPKNGPELVQKAATSI